MVVYYSASMIGLALSKDNTGGVLLSSLRPEEGLLPVDRLFCWDGSKASLVMVRARDRGDVVTHKRVTTW